MDQRGFPQKQLIPISALVLALGVGMTLVAAQTPSIATEPGAEVRLRITGESGAPPHYAVPDFKALTSDKETSTAARLIAEVLWNDLAFEREYDMIPRDTYKTIAQTSATDTIAFDRWREIGADGVVVGTVKRTGNTFQVEMRLFN